MRNEMSENDWKRLMKRFCKVSYRLDLPKDEEIRRVYAKWRLVEPLIVKPVYKSGNDSHSGEAP